MNFVPRRVMKSHSSHEDSRPLPGYESNKRSKWDSLYRRLAHSQPYLLVFTRSDRFIAEYLGVMLVMHKSVSLKYALEGRGTRTEEVPSVHQLAVHLVLEKGHQNARKNEPATNQQNKHQISASWAWTLVASGATASSLVERGTIEVDTPRRHLRGLGLRQDRDDPGQFAWSDRLLNVVLEPCAQDPGPLLGTGESREGSGGRRAATPRGQPAQLAHEPIAVLFGHLQGAHENILPPVRQDLECLVGRVDSSHRGSVVFQDLSNEPTHRSGVINDEDVHTTKEHIIT